MVALAALETRGATPGGARRDQSSASHDLSPSFAAFASVERRQAREARARHSRRCAAQGGGGFGKPA